MAMEDVQTKITCMPLLRARLRPHWQMGWAQTPSLRHLVTIPAHISPSVMSRQTCIELFRRRNLSDYMGAPELALLCTLYYYLVCLFPQRNRRL